MGGNHSRAVRDLYEVLLLTKDINVQTFSLILEILAKKGKNQDCLKSLTSSEVINLLNINNIEKITQILKIIKEHEFNKINYSTEAHRATRIWLISKISKYDQIQECLKFFVRLTAVDESLIQCGSNSLNLLVEMKAGLNYQFWENIRIKNTSLIGANFSSGSEFENVDMNGVNLNGAVLFNCKWSKISICELIKLNGHKKKVQQICFSPDSKTIASFSYDNTIQIWDVKTGKAKKQVIQKRWFDSLYYSPDGSTLASSGNFHGKIQLVNVITGKIKQILNNGTDYEYHLCFSHDGRSLLSGGKKLICLFDLQRCLLKYKLDVVGFRYLCYDGSTSIIIEEGHSIKMLDLTTGTLKQQLFEPQEDMRLFISDGKKIGSFRSWEGKLIFWDFQKGKKELKIQSIKELLTEMLGIHSPSKFTCDNLTKVWRPYIGEVKIKIYGHDSDTICFSPDGSKFALYEEYSICLQETKTLKQQLDRQSNKVNSVCYSPDGNTLASCSADKFIRLWDVRTEKLKQKINEHPHTVYSICFSPDGTILASSGEDNYIRFWNVKTGKLKYQLNGFFPDGNTILASNCDFSIVINLWEIKTGRLKFQFQGNEGCTTLICFSPDGTILASVSQKDAIFLWNVQFCYIKLKLNVHQEIISSICFSSDSATFASGSNFFIQWWDVQTGEIRQKIQREFDVTSLCFSPDSATLASGSGSPNNCIFLWNVQTGELRSKLIGHSKRVNSLSFSPDGKMLISASSDNSIRFWDINFDSLFQIKYNDYLKAYMKLNNIENIKLDVNPILNTKIISPNLQFQAQYALIFQSSFSNHSGMNLQRLFEQKGSIILEKLYK